LRFFANSLSQKEVLCVEVEKYKCLHDKSNFNYKNLDYTDSRWHEIAGVLSVEGEYDSDPVVQSIPFICD